MNASSVNKTWLKVCRYDRVLRKRIHSQLKFQRKSKLKSLLRTVRHTFRRQEQGKPFSVLNCLPRVTKPKNTGKYMLFLRNTSTFQRSLSLFNKLTTDFPLFPGSLAKPVFGKRKYENDMLRHEKLEKHDGRLTRMRF